MVVVLGTGPAHCGMNDTHKAPRETLCRWKEDACFEVGTESEERVYKPHTQYWRVDLWL